MYQTGQDEDAVSQWLRKRGKEVTRENWLSVAYPFEGDMPDPWTQEHEEQLPRHLQQIGSLS